MRLDKIKFAHLVKFITELEHKNHLDLETLDQLIDIDVPEPVRFDPELVIKLLDAMFDGRNFDAIKHWRAMFDHGLKESKDIVEKYMVEKTIEPKVTQAVDVVDLQRRMIDVLDKQKADMVADPVLEGFTDDQLNSVKLFVRSFQ